MISKKSNNAINIISWISVTAIAIATAALVIILSFMNGLTGLVQSLYNSFDPDIEITAAKGKTFVPDSVKLAELKKIPGVKYVCFSLEDNALVKYGDKQSFVTVKGVSDEFMRMTRFDTMITDGNKVLHTSTQHFGILGKGVAYHLSANIRDNITPMIFYAPKRGRNSGMDPSSSLNETEVIPGSLFTINDEFDFKYVLVDMEVARELFDYEKEVSSLEIGMEDASGTAEAKAKIQSLMGNDFLVKDRFQQNKILFSTLETEKLWTFVILIFILIVATFNINGALTMLIIEKRNDIVTLSNMGADISLIRRIFLSEGLMITCIGALIGLLLGLLICFLQQQTGMVAFSEGFVVDAYPVVFRWQDFVLILTAVFGIGLLAAWFPVRLLTRESSLLRFRVQ